MRWTTAKIRQSFLDFFAERGHTIVPSASIIPEGDPTLLFTNAGMVQFKDYFLGIRTPPHARVADCQKCLRISGKHNDLEAVGRDTYHHTFFEMLGNWSFGDYYKDEAIAWHWELITKVWGIDPKLLWATVYKEDDEAEGVWRKLRTCSARSRSCGSATREFLADGRHRARAGRARRFTSIAARRPATPAACGRACGVNVDGCERFIELGNLVFIQYNRDAAGKLTPLPMKHVDTGTGLERVAAALQSIETGKLLGNYDIDLFQTIIKRIEQSRHRRARQRRALRHRTRNRHLIPRDRGPRARDKFPHRGRCPPGNTDREYVLRRIIRRAARHGRYLGIQRPFLAQVRKGVVDAMGEAYPELKENSPKIAEVLHPRKSRFGETLGSRPRAGSRHELERMQDTGRADAVGRSRFQLYDTYGFPIDLTQDVLRDEASTSTSPASIG